MKEKIIPFFVKVITGPDVYFLKFLLLMIPFYVFCFFTGKIFKRIRLYFERKFLEPRNERQLNRKRKVNKIIED